MARLLIFFVLAASLAGCYNPRYPSEATTAETPYRSSEAEDKAARDRRDAAAASGSSYRR